MKSISGQYLREVLYSSLSELESSLNNNSDKDQGDGSNVYNIALNVKRTLTSVTLAEEHESWENIAFLRSDRAVYVDPGNVHYAARIGSHRI